MIHIFEPHSKHFEHFGYNGGLLQSFERLGVKYTFHGVEAHCLAIEQGVGLKNFNVRFLRDHRSRYLSKTLSLLRVLEIYRYRSAQQLLILSSTTFMNFLLLFFCLVFKTNIYVILHSEISNQAPDTISRKLRFLFKFRPENLQFIVNADFIKKRLERHDTEFQFISILHPVPEALNREKIESSYVGFCSVGSYSTGKNSDRIVQLKRLLGERVKLGHIGPLVSTIYDKKILSTLSPAPDEQALDVVQFQALLEGVSGVVMFPTLNYQYYTVSGVVVDALANGKVILSTRSKSIERLKQLIPSTLFVFDEIEEMAIWILENKDRVFDTSRDLNAWRNIVDESVISLFQNDFVQ